MWYIKTSATGVLNMLFRIVCRIKSDCDIVGLGTNNGGEYEKFESVTPAH